MIFHYDRSERDTQEYWFRRQIRLANEMRMPIVIHSRDADKKTMDILKEEGAFSEERADGFLPEEARGTPECSFTVSAAAESWEENM